MGLKLNPEANASDENDLHSQIYDFSDGTLVYTLPVKTARRLTEIFSKNGKPESAIVC